MELDDHGNLNLLFQGIESMSNKNSKNNPQPPQANEIPFNIPLNLFGNLLSAPLAMP